MPQFGTYLRESAYGAAPPRIGRLLPKTGRLQAEKQKASYEKAEGFLRKGGRLLPRWLHMYILCIRTGCSRLHVQHCAMAVLSKYVKQRIVSLKEKGLTNREIVAALKRERVSAIQSGTTQAVRRCYVKYIQTGSIERRRGSGRPTLRTAGVLQAIETIMQGATRQQHVKYVPTYCDKARDYCHSP